MFLLTYFPMDFTKRNRWPKELDKRKSCLWYHKPELFCNSKRNNISRHNRALPPLRGPGLVHRKPRYSFETTTRTTVQSGMYFIRRCGSRRGYWRTDHSCANRKEWGVYLNRCDEKKSVSRVEPPNSATVESVVLQTCPFDGTTP